MLKDDVLEAAIGFMQWNSGSIEWLESLNNSTSKWAKLATFSVVVALVAAMVGALAVQREL